MLTYSVNMEHMKNALDAQSDFGKNFVTKKLLLSYILNLSAL